MTTEVTESHDSKTLFGFWVYLMTECLLFGSLFATYAVLRNSTYGGPSGKELFDLSFALSEKLVLLASSFTCALASLAVNRNNKRGVLIWYIITLLLGLTFLGMEWKEFSHLVETGNSWRRSAFLSAFFTLVGTHGLHIIAGVIWISVLLPLVMKRGLTEPMIRKLSCLRLFWFFLDFIWIFIFTFVYLMGASA